MRASLYCESAEIRNVRVAWDALDKHGEPATGRAGYFPKPSQATVVLTRQAEQRALS